MPLEDGMLVYDGAGALWVCAPCVQCGCVFNMHPDRVPSVVGVWHGRAFIPVKLGEQCPAEAVREPVCRACIERANSARKPGEPQIEVLPGAYGPALFP